jgi:hypothetical protein
MDTAGGRGGYFVSAKNETMTIAIQIIFLALNIGAARWQAWWLDVKQRSIKKWQWATAYLFLAFAASGGFDIGGTDPYWNETGRHYNWRPLGEWWRSINWTLLSAIILQRLLVFNTFLNYWRIPRRPLFYTNPIWSKKNGSSWLDKLWGDWYPVVFVGNLMAYITIQFFI